MKRLGWQVIGGALLALILVSNFVSPLGWGRGSGIMGGLGFPMMGMMGMLLFWVLIIGGVIGLAGPLVRSWTSSSIPPQGESAFEILKKRYSRGEITKEQFEEMKGNLGL